ncbi:hypothetical protein BGX27_008526 [Mortierella sp. AM989]|nr:hypothetical protein BGX27_008526 [Mortierella sp. AM989]
MVASSSVSNPTPTIDWADDTDEEIDFGAPVFSDDEDFSPALTRDLGSSSPLPIENHEDNGNNRQNNKDGLSTQPPLRYTAGFADGSNRSLDRKTLNDSTLRPMSSRIGTRDRSSPYHDAPNTHHDRASSNNHHNSGVRGASSSFEKDSHRRPDNRRDNNLSGLSSVYGSPRNNSSHLGRQTDDRGTGSGQRLARQVIPLPPKPPASLNANNSHINRSRSPSYRSLSPLPGTEHRRDNSKQRPSSPYTDTHRSFSPSTTHPPSGLSTRSASPGHHSKAHMDQLSQGKDYSKRQSRDNVPGSRWEKTPHEDKPYPTVASASPKDDLIYFKRRDGRANEPTKAEKPPSGTMYHERLELNDIRRHRSEKNDNSSDRWEKIPVTEPDRPYPERAHPPHNNVNDSHGGHARTKSRGQIDIAPADSSPHVEKTSQRGNRGKGKDQHKRQSKDHQPDSNADNEGSAVPWWEQSTYGSGKKDEPKLESTEQIAKESKDDARPATARSKNKGPTGAQSSSKESQTTASETKDIPWWEQSTYKINPKTDSVEQVSSGLADVSLGRSDSTLAQKNNAYTTQPENETMAKRKAIGKTVPASGVEALTLVSRDGDATG